MLNFKKGSIFSRSAGNEDAYEEYEQEDQGAYWQSGAAPAVARPQSPHGLQSTLPASAKTRFFSSAICPPPCCPASAHPGISKTKDLWGASWLPPMCLTV